MKYLVTGATGLLGNNIVRLLIERGEAVRALSRSATRSAALADLPIERIDASVADEDAVQAAMRDIDRVIHCAACVEIGWTNAEQYEQVNVKGAELVARAALEREIRMVHVSTVNSLGAGWPDRPGDEENFNPDITPCPYVTSKHRADEKLDELVELENADIVTILPGYMLGPWDWKPSSGQMLLDVARGRPPVTPTGALSFTDARDVAAGALAAGDRGQTGRNYIMAGHNMRYREAWKAMAALTGRRPPRLPLGPIVRGVGGGVADLVLWATGKESIVNSAAMQLSRIHHTFSSQRAIDELGYSIRPFEQILEDAWAWFREHGYAK